LVRPATLRASRAAFQPIFAAEASVHRRSPNSTLQADFRAQLEVNLASPLRGTQAFASLLSADRSRRGASSTSAPSAGGWRFRSWVLKALTASRPRANYLVTPQRFKNWTVPMLLP